MNIFFPLCRLFCSSGWCLLLYKRLSFVRSSTLLCQGPAKNARPYCLISQTVANAIDSPPDGTPYCWRHHKMQKYEAGTDLETPCLLVDFQGARKFRAGERSSQALSVVVMTGLAHHAQWLNSNQSLFWLNFSPPAQDKTSYLAILLSQEPAAPQIIDHRGEHAAILLNGHKINQILTTCQHPINQAPLSPHQRSFYLLYMVITTKTRTCLPRLGVTVEGSRRAGKATASSKHTHMSAAPMQS